MQLAKKSRVKQSLSIDIEDSSTRDAVWLQSQLVARVHYSGLTPNGQLRHAVYKGMRMDVEANNTTYPDATDGDVQLNKTSSRKPKINVPEKIVEQLADIKFSHPDKIYYPSIGATKLDVVKYYLSVAERLCSYIGNRAVNLIRYPDGIEQSSFFQKHPSQGMHRSIETTVYEGDDYLVISTPVAIAAAVQIGTIEFHPWSCQIDRLDKPDRVIFDFDPHENVDWPQVVESAQHCKSVLDRLELQSFVKTSGGKGLHVVVPITRRKTWDEVLMFAQQVAKRMSQERRESYTLNMSKKSRDSKILIDVHRNHRGSTCAAAYSLRATPNATVSMPLTWDELKKLRDAPNSTSGLYPHCSRNPIRGSHSRLQTNL